MNNSELSTADPQDYLTSVFYILAFLSIISGIILAIIFWPKYSYSISWLFAGIIQGAICASIAHIISYLQSIAHNTEHLIGKKYSSSVPYGMRTCPFCEEYIKSGALKCPYCTSEVPVKDNRISNRKSGESGPVGSEKVIHCRNCGMAHSVQKKWLLCECGFQLKPNMSD